MTPEQRAGKIVDELDYMACDYDRFEFGLPQHPEQREKLDKFVADQIREAVSEERERILSLVYAEDRSFTQVVSASSAVARVCDEVLDKSGGLLGRVRDSALKILEDK